jgi:hypothetical protein
VGNREAIFLQRKYYGDCIDLRAHFPAVTQTAGFGTYDFASNT